MTFAALGDSAVVMTLGDAMSETARMRVRLLAEALEKAQLRGIVDVVPAYATVAVYYEPAHFAGGGRPAHEAVCAALAACAEAAAIEDDNLRPPAPDRYVEVPVCYGGDFGPDLEVVAQHCRMSAAEVIARHSGGDYRVQAIGFAPGFPYLSGLPESLRTPRRPTPRTAVPAGSVGIGGAQTGVYSLETPGGWQLIGRTPLRLFRPKERAPSLMRVGDRVRFRPVDSGEYRRHWEEYRMAPSPQTLPQDAASCHVLRDKAPGIEVIKPGLLTTVQDLGRRGYRAAGIPLGGAMDPFALRVANLLVGNAEDAAGLEITLIGPELAFTADALVAICGAEFDGIPAWRPVPLRAGERLKFGEGRRGCRAYLAVSGGLDVPPVLGSRSTYLRAKMGGFQGRALREGDRLGAGPGGRESSRAGSWRVSSGILPAYSADVTLRVLRGAQAGDFEGKLWDTEFRVSPNSDRMGLRLDGPKLDRGRAEELVSSAVVPGTVQVPPDGHPIVLMADAQTIGGYPQAAHVIGADLPLAAQLRPGDRLRFREVGLEEARSLSLAREGGLAHLRAGLIS